MLRVFLDDLPFPSPGPAVDAAASTPPTPTPDLIQSARAAATARGRMIVEALLNGQPAPQELLDGDHTADGDLHLFTADPRHLVADVLRAASTELESASTAQRAAAVEICRGDLGEAVGRLQSIAQVWERVQQAAAQGPALLDQFGAAREAGLVRGAFTAGSTALALNLAALKCALATEDWSALADLLEGDLEDRVAQWQEALCTAADSCTTTTAAVVTHV